jgi:hypothetical protein
MRLQGGVGQTFKLNMAAARRLAVREKKPVSDNPSPHPDAALIRVYAPLINKKAGIFLLDESKEIYNIWSSTRAIGTPHSKERLQHLETIWLQQHPELHLIVPHEEGTRELWMKQFICLQQGQSYFLTVVSQLADADYLSTLSRISGKASLGQNAENSVDASYTEAVISYGLWISRKSLTNNGSRVLAASSWVPTKDLQ